MPVDMNMNILIVEGYKAMLEIVEAFLKQLGFRNVTPAADGSAALQMLREGNFALVIADWHMLPMTGLRLLKEVRADSKLKGMPFIMVTSEGTMENAVAAKEAGVSNYLVKPFNAETFKQKIAAVIGPF